MSLSSNGTLLAVCNLPDNKLELFDVSTGSPVPIAVVPVGLDPVSARFRTCNEVWVVNHISSSVSVVDLARRQVVATLRTLNGPADVVFAGTPPRAFVSCANENRVQVFDPVSRQLLTALVVDGDRPKAMATSADGSKVFVAIFESGNASTLLVGAALRDPRGPYGGQFPVPNDGTNQTPPLYISTNVTSGVYTQASDSLIVKRNLAGRWMDDNNGDWTEFVSGTNSTVSEPAGIFGRPLGWQMPDRDVAIIDAATYAISYATGLMNICMDLAVNPASGKVAVIGIDATNERRFEPRLRGTFVRVNLAQVNPATLQTTISDLNPHLDYSTPSVASALRQQSIGDPRGIIWNAAGTRGYVSGMGSGNLIVIDGDGQRIGQPVELGEGASGLALDESRTRLYVLNRFAATISVLDTTTLNVRTNVALFDPTPEAIKIGRKHLYDTRKSSGLGQASCASCHVDGRFDRLAWDLGDPSAEARLPSGAEFHPMKGPLVTQTLQDIIGHEPLHWRGDRMGIENFNGTFTNLMAADALLTTNEMQEFKEFLGTIHFPPNRFRNFDNTLPLSVPLPGQYGLDESGLPGAIPLANGNAQRGQRVFVNLCRSCHQEESGRGVAGEDILARRENNRPFKVAQLRGLADKLGMDRVGTSSRAGFGFRFDGRDDSLTRLLLELFGITTNPEIADISAFLLSFSGSGVAVNPPPDAALSKDAPAAVGQQLTFTGGTSNSLLAGMLTLADSGTGRVELVVRGSKDGVPRGWFFDRATGLFQSDRHNEDITSSGLMDLAAAGNALTFTMVPEGSGRRLGIDRDNDGYFDRTEMEFGFDPQNAASRGTNSPPQVDPVPVLVVHPGREVTSRIISTPPEIGQALTFSLGPDAPAGATIDAATGVVSWRPDSSEIEHTNRFSVRATDNGLPPLSTSIAVQVFVNRMKIVAIRKTGNGPVTLDWRSISNYNYRVEYATQLANPTWTSLNPVHALGPVASTTDPTAGSTSVRLYRILLLHD